MYEKLGRVPDAENSYRKALTILEETKGPGHADVATILMNYAGLLRRNKRKNEARHLEDRATAILASHQPPAGAVSFPINTVR